MNYKFFASHLAVVSVTILCYSNLAMADARDDLPTIEIHLESLDKFTPEPKLPATYPHKLEHKQVKQQVKRTHENKHKKLPPAVIKPVTPKPIIQKTEAPKVELPNPKPVIPAPIKPIPVKPIPVEPVAEKPIAKPAEIKPIFMASPVEIPPAPQPEPKQQVLPKPLPEPVKAPEVKLPAPPAPVIPAALESMELPTPPSASSAPSTPPVVEPAPLPVLPAPAEKPTEKPAEKLPEPKLPEPVAAPALPAPTPEALPSPQSLMDKLPSSPPSNSDVKPDADKGKPDSSIIFLATETAVPLPAEASLKDIATKMKGGSSRVTLVAYASGAGDKATTARRVSLSRALAVRAYLIEHDVDKLRISVQAEGDKDAGSQPDRVDIFLDSGKVK